ncbi:MAG TPA: MerC domain-containing protein [Chitinophagaceae bacterium]
MSGIKINWDALGISASLACAIHCALLPLFLQALPIFGINIIDNVLFEVFMICLAAAIGMYSLYHGWTRHHHKTGPILLFSVGMVLLLLKQIWHQHQLWFLVPAVLLIVSAHLRNFRLIRKTAQCNMKGCDH